jgi:predicted transcriptional regulator
VALRDLLFHPGDVVATRGVRREARRKDRAVIKHDDIQQVFNTIKVHPGLRTSDIIEQLDLPRPRVEDAIWELWSSGKIQIESDSTLRVTREGETVFRHFAP